MALLGGQVACGADHSLLLTDEGGIWAAGRGYHWQFKAL